MTRRGMTLLETLLAVALTAAIAGACLSLVRLAGRDAAPLAEAARWDAAADATLRLIGDELACGDLPAAGSPAARARIAVADGSLTIAARPDTPDGCAPAAAPHRHSFRLDAAQHTLVREAPPNGRAGVATRPLLGELAGFETSIDEKAEVLRVELRATDGRTRSRRYPLP